MKLSILCSDAVHPAVPSLRRWQTLMQAAGHEVELRHHKREVFGGDILFLVSCSQIVGEAERARYRAVLVLHASDLPHDRGWSPHVWNIVEGQNRITVSLLSACDPVDTGDIWLKTYFELQGHELLPEINEHLFRCELELMTQAVERFEQIRPVPQAGEEGNYRRKRTPEDSRLHPEKPLAEQFDLLRVVDNDRYPAFFEYRGHRYMLKIEKAKT